MNIFFGLPVAKEKINLLNQFLLQEHPSWENDKSIRWTFQDCHHITLHFFGPIVIEKLNELRADLPHCLQKTAAFEIEILKIDNFPKKSSDLVAAYVHLSEELAQLYQRVEQLVEQYHFPQESRSYLPHITLCRSRTQKLSMKTIMLNRFQIPISSLMLYQTQATPNGSFYKPLEIWKL